MFSRKDQLLRKTGEFGIGRYDFLRQLIVEYTTTTNYECKKQTLANLANFAYDPINYEFIKQLHLTDLFLSELSGQNEELIHFALSGLCNLSCDPESREYIISLNGIKLITDLLLHKNVEISLNSLTTLYYLFESKHAKPSEEVKEIIYNYEGEMIRMCHHITSQKIYILSNNLPILPFIGNLSRHFSDEVAEWPEILRAVTVSKQIMKEDVEKFAALSGDTNIIHSSTLQEKAIVHGAYLNALVSGVIGTRLPGHGSIVVEQTLKFPNKCYVGETVDITVKLTSNRKILKVDYYCDVKENNKRVLTGSAKLIKSIKYIKMNLN